MKPTSRAEYLARIDCVVGRLSSSIAQEQPLPTIAELASAAHLSQFHFMRMYRALAGEALGRTIQRLRLRRAVHLLTTTQASITEISGRVGFETAQAFAKAFRQAVGLSPTQLRELPSEGLAPINAALHHTPPASEPAPAIRVDVVELDPFRVVAIRNHGAYEDLDAVYGQLLGWLADRGALESMTGIWGVPYHDRRDEPGESAIFDCCVATNVPLPADSAVMSMELGGGSYVTNLHVGSYGKLDDTHDFLLRNALPARALTLRDAPIIHQFLNDPETTAEAQLETVIFVPIERD